MARRRLSVLDVAPAVALFTVMSLPWLTTQAVEARDARVVPFELAVTQTEAAGAAVLLGRKGGGYEAPRRYRAVRELAGEVIADDLDGDRFIDLAVTDPTRNDVAILHGRPLTTPR